MDYHVLEISVDGGKAHARVAMHIPTPAGNNAAGTSFAAALAEKNGTVTSVLPSITGPEQTALNDGSLVEVVETVELIVAQSNAEKQAALDAAYTAAVAREQAEIQKRMWGWGFERNVV